LMNSEDSTPAPERPVSRRRKWLRRLAVLGLLMVAALVWLDGPGQRWLLPMAARHFLKPYQIDISFVPSGRITSHFALHEIRVSGGPIREWKIGELRPIYSLWHRDFAGLELRGMTLRYDLDQKFPNTGTAPDEEPLRVAQLIEQLQQWRQKLGRLHVHIDGQNIAIHRGDTAVARIRDIALDHGRHSEQWKLRTRGLEWGDQEIFPQQENTITWTDEQVAIDSIQMAADLAARDVQLSTPDDAQIAFSTRAILGTSTWDLQVTPGLTEISLQLSEGTFTATDAKDAFGIELPFKTLEKCRLRITPSGFSLDSPEDFSNVRADLTVDLLVRDAFYQNYRADAISLQFEKNSASFTSTVRSSAYGGEAAIRLSGQWDADPLNLEQLSHCAISGNITLPEIQQILTQTYPLWSSEGKTPATTPASASLEISGKARIDGRKISAVDAAMKIDHRDPAHPDLSLTVHSPDANTWSTTGKSDGVDLSGSYQIDARSYDAKMTLRSFLPGKFSPLVAWLDLSPPTGMNADLNWSGRGNLAENTHVGTCLVEKFSWLRGEQEILADVVASYQWPQSASIKDLRARVGQQEIRLDAAYAPGSIAVTRLQHRDGDQTLLEGHAQVPWPETWKGIDEWFATPQPWNLRLKSKALPLSLANQWLPPDQPLPLSGIAQLDIAISGSPAAPEISANAALTNIRHLAHPDLASADLSLSLIGKNQLLELDGRLATSRTNPVTLRARMPYRPAAWRQDPQLLRKETWQASADIPQLELARFTDLAPSVKNLTGKLSGRIDVGGSLDDPHINGSLALNNFSAHLNDPRIAPLRNGSGKFTFSDRHARIDSLRVELAGGSLALSGSAELNESATPRLDFRLTGNAIPLWRDDNLISRANANITLTGPYETAGIRGSIDIVDSLLYKDVEIIPIGKPFNLAQAAELPKLDQRQTAGVASLPAPFNNWPLDLVVRTAEPFLIRGNLATGQIRLDCRIGGTLGTPLPKGQAELRDITAALPLSRLEVKSGFVRFTPQSGLDPVLEIRGNSRVSNHAINIFVYGNASAPRILLTSEPPLPENEIMTLLATGTTTKGLADGSAAQSRALQLIIEEFRRGRLPLGRRLAPFLERLEDVELAVGEQDPYSGRQRSSVKMPFSSKWSIFGAVDGEGKTRNLLLFQIKFR
jgi:hypothetical protein